jgi:hypothetical protein
VLSEPVMNDSFHAKDEMRRWGQPRLCSIGTFAFDSEG